MNFAPRLRLVPGIALIALLPCLSLACSKSESGEPSKQDHSTPTPAKQDSKPAESKPTTDPKATTPADAKSENKSADAVDAKAWQTARDEARIKYDTFCMLCHGTKGKGDGPTGKVLTPKPRDYTDKAWQAKVTDQHLEDVIRDGGAKHGLSALMAPNSNLDPLTIKALREIVRGFAK